MIDTQNIPNEKVLEKINALNHKAWKQHYIQPKLAIELANEAKELSEQNYYKSGLAYSLRNLGVSNRYLSNFDEALTLSVEALNLFIELEDTAGESQADASIGAISYYMGDYDRALDYYSKAIEIGTKIKNYEALAYAYNGSGYIYSILGEHEKGLDSLNQALAFSRELKNFFLENSCLESLAVVYINNNQIDQAYSTYLELANLSEQRNDKRNQGYALYGIGDILNRQNKLEEAKGYFLKSFKIHEEIGYRIGKSLSLLSLGKIAFKENQIEDAKQLFQQSLDVGESIKAKATIYEAHEALSELYKSIADFDNFAHHYKLFQKFKAEVFQDKQESKEKYLTLKYEMDSLKKEAEISRLTNVVMKEKNAELEKKTDELEQSYNNISILSKIGQDITSTLDLLTILNTVYENTNELMDATVFGIGIYNEEANNIEYRMSIEKGVKYQPYVRTMEDQNQFPVWCITNKKEVFINNIETEYSTYLPNLDLTILKGAEMEDGSIPEKPMSLIYLPLLVKDKVIGLISVQSYNTNAYTSNHLNILRTLASYASAALYNASSFETLENTLKELKLTQAQLLQSEKMASLGELTAGIAHEIQNPLNFVNNFSEVSSELLGEMKEEIEGGNLEDAMEIVDDLVGNLDKIYLHGRRASSIVKGMLSHSRVSTGDKELTDLNALSDEFLRLSYHGLRARDRDFNAKYITEFDEHLPKVEVVSQDIGRVILNLINNAFYAVHEKQKLLENSNSPNGQTYKPTIHVATKTDDNQLIVSVRDNGNGMPKEVLDKIFQPFFTTKPTGQGTGLGLSLSYDIIQAHGGKIVVNSKRGKGTEMIISLPVNG